jgi:hypothetical protein
VRLLTLLALLAWMPTPTLGQSNPSFPDHLIRIYGPSDPLLETKFQIEKMMGVYLTHPPRRHTSERVTIKKTNVTVDVWQSVQGLSDSEIECRAVRWLVFGRTQYGQGGREVLSHFTDLKQVKLRFHEVIRSKNSRRRKKNKARTVRYLNLTLKRQHLRTLDLQALKASITSGQCTQAFKSTMSGKLSRRHTKKRRKTR